MYMYTCSNGGIINIVMQQITKFIVINMYRFQK